PNGPGSRLNADQLDGIDSTAFAQSATLATPGTINTASNPVDWTKLKGVPSVALTPLPGGASAAIVTSITVNAKSDCGNLSPVPYMEVYVNGALVGGTGVTGSTYADTAPFAVSPARFTSEIAIAFTNDGLSGTCDRNLYVD